MNMSCSVNLDLLNSTTLFFYVYRPYELVLFKFVIPCIILVGIISNTTFIWTVIRVSSLHTSTFMYLFGLACTDLFTLVGDGMNLANNLLNSPVRFGNIPMLRGIAAILKWFSFISSISFVTLVSLERYLAICHPLKYRLIKGTKRTIKLSLMTIVLSLGITSTIVVQNFGTPLVVCIVWPADDQFNVYPHQITTFTAIGDLSLLYYKITNIAYALFYLFLLTSTCYMYTRILITLRKRKHNKVLQLSTELERNINQIATMVITNGLVFFLCSTIIIIFMTCATLDLFGVRFLDRYQVDVLERVQDIFILVNASVNPLIFLTNRGYRSAVSTAIMKHGFRRHFGNKANNGHISMKHIGGNMVNTDMYSKTVDNSVLLQ
ncbi:kappa-type opioid receptor-like [Amphiura filiformis]|uniref:kappa-type opioid receptor-like n=1 Tax=Amphiura filiformis TaxID=82378 RepID=UPI003B22037E